MSHWRVSTKEDGRDEECVSDDERREHVNER